jgi:hypothetical protein
VDPREEGGGQELSNRKNQELSTHRVPRRGAGVGGGGGAGTEHLHVCEDGEEMTPGGGGRCEQGLSLGLGAAMWGVLPSVPAQPHAPTMFVVSTQIHWQ